MNSKDVAVMMVFLAALATAAWVIHLANETAKRRRKLNAQTDLNNRLLDKFSSAHEVVEFLQTPGGAHFVDSLSGEREDPATAILRSTHRGIILVVVATGCLFLSWYYRNAGENPLFAIGVIMFCLGAGFLISAGVSHRLSRALSSGQK